MNGMEYKSAHTAGRAIIRDKDRYGVERSDIDTVVGWAPYFVSALASDQKLIGVNYMNWVAGALDVFIHVAIWVVAMIFEILVWYKADDLQSAAAPDTRTFAFATASLVCFIVPCGIVLLSFFVHMLGSKIAPGNFFPFLTAMIEGGLSSSILFTLICVLYTVGITAASDDWRNQTITLLTFKILASSFINANVRRALNRDHAYEAS
jgi:hypothetical protein